MMIIIRFDGFVKNGAEKWPELVAAYDAHPTLVSAFGDAGDAAGQAHMRELTDYVLAHRAAVVSRLYEALATRRMTLVHGSAQQLQ